LKHLMQRHWFTNIRKADAENILAVTDYMDNHMERRAFLKVETSSLKITEAWLERPGQAGNMTESTIYIDSLQGVQAYLGSGPQLREALKSIGENLERTLFNDCVIGIVQAETFLFPERGYQDVDAYNNFWEKSYVGSCRYYSNLDQVKKNWMDYIGFAPRRLNLFSRSKSQQLMEDEQGNRLVAGSLVDSFHQMASFLQIDPEGKVITASGQLVRGPDEVCFSAADFMDELRGIKLAGKSKKEIAGILGTSQGCIHLIDLVYDSVQTLDLIGP
jgi:hypothetical protein